MFNTTFCSSKEEEGKHAASVDSIQKMFLLGILFSSLGFLFFYIFYRFCLWHTKEAIISWRRWTRFYVIPDLKSKGLKLLSFKIYHRPNLQALIYSNMLFNDDDDDDLLQRDKINSNKSFER